MTRSTFAKSSVIVLFASFAGLAQAQSTPQPSYPDQHQKQVVPGAQPAQGQQKYEPEQDQGRQSTEYPSKHSNETVRDRNTKKKASERAKERERSNEGQTIPEPRN